MVADAVRSLYLNRPVRLLCAEDGKVLPLAEENLRGICGDKTSSNQHHDGLLLIEVWLKIEDMKRVWNHEENEVLRLPGYTIVVSPDYVCVLSRACNRLRPRVMSMYRACLEVDRYSLEENQKVQHETFLYLHSQLARERSVKEVKSETFLCKQMPTGKWVQLDLATSSSRRFYNMTILTKLQRKRTENLQEILDFTKHYKPDHFKELSSCSVGWLLTPYCVTFHEILRIKKRAQAYPVFSVMDIGGIIGQLINGLEYLHQSGIVHMQISSNNVFCDTNRAVKIGNFDFSKSIPALIKTATRNGGIERFKGVVHLYPPELYSVCAKEQSFTAIDMWALGLLAVELFLGKHPFRSVPKAELLERMTSWNQNPADVDCLAICSEVSRLTFQKKSNFGDFLLLTIHADPAHRTSFNVLRFCSLCSSEGKRSIFGRSYAVDDIAAEKPLSLTGILVKLEDLTDERLSGRILEYLLDKIQPLIAKSGEAVGIGLLLPEPDQIAEWIGFGIGNLYKFCCYLKSSEISQEQEDIRVLLERGVELCVQALVIIASIVKEGLAELAASFTVFSAIFIIFMILRICYRIIPKRYKYFAQNQFMKLPYANSLVEFLRLRKGKLMKHLRSFQLLVISFARIHITSLSRSMSLLVFPDFTLAMERYFDSLIQVKHRLDLRQVKDFPEHLKGQLMQAKDEVLHRISQNLWATSVFVEHEELTRRKRKRKREAKTTSLLLRNEALSSTSSCGYSTNCSTETICFDPDDFPFDINENLPQSTATDNLPRGSRAQDLYSNTKFQFVDKTFLPTDMPMYNKNVNLLSDALLRNLEDYQKTSIGIDLANWDIGDISNWDLFISTFSPILNSSMDSHTLLTDYGQATTFIRNVLYISQKKGQGCADDVRNAENCAPQCFENCRDEIEIAREYESPSGFKNTFGSSDSDCLEHRVCTNNCQQETLMSSRDSILFPDCQGSNHEETEIDSDYYYDNYLHPESASGTAFMWRKDPGGFDLSPSSSVIVSDDDCRECHDTETPGSSSVADPYPLNSEGWQTQSSTASGTAKKGWKTVRQKIPIVSRFFRLIARKRPHWKEQNEADLVLFRSVRTEMFRKLAFFMENEESFKKGNLLLSKFSPWSKLRKKRMN